MKQESYKVLFVAGGTGGHIVPAIAVAQKLKQLEPKVEVIFCGVGKEIEKNLVIPAGFELLSLPFPPFRGVSLLKKFKFFYELPLTVLKARRVIKKLKINSVIAFGGYPSVCPMIAAWSLKLNRLLHEQNQQVGLANQLLEFFATKVFAVTGATGFRKPELVQFLPLPVRAQFREIPELELSGEPRLLVLGGSQGARKINEAVVELLPFLKEHKVSVFHQSGSADFERTFKAYEGYERGEVVAFTNDVASALKNTWVIISRAGAMSVAEICAAGRASIYVPLKIAGAHQSANIAGALKSKAAISVNQDEQLVENLKNELEALFKDNAKLLRLGKSARELSLHGEQGSEEIIARAVLW